MSKLISLTISEELLDEINNFMDIMKGCLYETRSGTIRRILWQFFENLKIIEKETTELDKHNKIKYYQCTCGMPYPLKIIRIPVIEIHHHKIEED